MMNKNIKKYIKTIERTHRGLGIPLLFEELSYVAQKSVFFIAPMGTGKTTLVKSLKVHESDKNLILNLNQVTKGLLAEYLYDVKEKNIIVKIPEWSTLSPYHRELFLTMFSTLVTDRNIYYKLQGSDQISVENSDTTIFIAIQPLKFAKMLSENENWESLASDRFTKFLLINPLRKSTTKRLPLNQLVEMFPNALPELKEDIKVSDKIIQPITNVFLTQFTKNRALLYSRDYAKSLALLLNLKRVTKQVVKLFLQLFSPYLLLYDKFLIRYTLDERVQLSSACINMFSTLVQYEEISKRELARLLHVREREIERVSSILNDELGLITKVATNERTIAYKPSTWLRQFFEWYKKTF